MSDILRHYQILEEFYLEKDLEADWNEIKCRTENPSLKSLMRTITQANEQGNTIEIALENRYLKKSFTK